MKTLLFLCTGNSCRSQMAEGFAKKYLAEEFQVFSAGTKKHGLNPYAVKVMEEVGVDISNHESNTVDELPVKEMDFVVTVCSDAHENCPYFPGGKIVHIGFDDPPSLTKDFSDENEKFNVYRRVRDEIEEKVKVLKSHL